MSITLITLLVDYLFTPQSRHVSDWEPSGEFEYLIACLQHLVFIWQCQCHDKGNKTVVFLNIHEHLRVALRVALANCAHLTFTDVSSLGAPCWGSKIRYLICSLMQTTEHAQPQRQRQRFV